MRKETNGYRGQSAWGPPDPCHQSTSLATRKNWAGQCPTDPTKGEFTWEWKCLVNYYLTFGAVPVVDRPCFPRLQSDTAVPPTCVEGCEPSPRPAGQSAPPCPTPAHSRGALPGGVCPGSNRAAQPAGIPGHTLSGAHVGCGSVCPAAVRVRANRSLLGSTSPQGAEPHLLPQVLSQDELTLHAPVDHVLRHLNR